MAKIMNILGDFASAAVPAGIAYLASGGNPLAAASAGAKGFAQNEQEERIRKLQKQQQRNDSMANLINTLASRPTFQAKQAAVPSAGIMEQVASGAARGIDTYQMFDQLRRQNELMDLKKRGAEQALELGGKELDKADRAAQTAAGQAKFAALQGFQQDQAEKIADTVPLTDALDKPWSVMSGVASAASPRTPTDSEAMSFFESGTPLRDPDAQFRPSGQFEAAGFAQAQQAADDRQMQRQLFDSNMANARLERFVKMRELGAKPGRKMSDIVSTVEAFGTVNPGMSPDDFFSSPSILSLEGETPFSQAERANLWNSYQQAAQERGDVLDEVTRTTVKGFKDELRTDPLIKERAELTRALSFVQNALVRPGGFSDVQLLKMLARLQDPNSVVRQEEFNTLKDAQSLFERAGIAINRWFEGGELTDTGRAEVARLAMDGYNDRFSTFRDRINAAQRTALATPGTGAGFSDVLNLAADEFRLPSLQNLLGSDYGTFVQFIERNLPKNQSGAKSTFSPQAQGLLLEAIGVDAGTSQIGSPAGKSKVFGSLSAGGFGPNQWANT